MRASCPPEQQRVLYCAIKTRTISAYYTGTSFERGLQSRYVVLAWIVFLPEVHLKHHDESRVKHPCLALQEDSPDRIQPINNTYIHAIPDSEVFE